MKLNRHKLSCRRLSECVGTSGLIAWYPLKKNVLNYLDNSTATNFGVPITSDGGFFDGTTYIDTGLDGEIDHLLAESSVRWSLNVWFVADPNTSSQAIVGRGGGFGSATTFALYRVNGNQLRVRLRGGNEKTTTIPLGEWVMCTVTWDGIDATLYVNKENKGVIDVGSTALQGNLTAQIGCIDSKVSNYGFTGNIKDVRFYDRALSENVITEIYNATKLDAPLFSFPPPIGQLKNQFKEVFN